LSTQGKYLEQQNGEPFLLVADAGWEFMTQLTEEEAVAYLDDRKTKGFNAVEIRVIGRKFQTNAPNDFYNEPPFTSGLKDWSVRNEAYWKRIDFLLKAMRDGGYHLSCISWRRLRRRGLVPGNVSADRRDNDGLRDLDWQPV
jgi:hypothetical protein